MRRGLKHPSVGAGRHRRGAAARAAPDEKGTETKCPLQPSRLQRDAARAAPDEKGTETRGIAVASELQHPAARAAPDEKGTETRASTGWPCMRIGRARGPR